MTEKLKISSKFKPLFSLLEGKHSEVDTVVITGGRYSLKSYSVSVFSNVAMYYYGWNVLYTRYTNTSIVDSIKPEVSDKTELLGIKQYVKDTSTHIEYNGSRIAFKGIKPGSGQQTANLKSLSGFNCFVNDEAEELPDFKTFKKVFYSMRDTEKRNLSILILNPTTKEHWIFKEFFEKKGLEGGDNCIVDNIMYIHSSYLDCDHKLMPANILADYKRMRDESPSDYENVVLGGWITEVEGLLLPKSSLKFVDISSIPAENAIFRFAISDPADTGGDKYSNPFISVYEINGRIMCAVDSVIHSADGIEANAERITIMAAQHCSEMLLVEDNGVGLAALMMIKKNLPKNIKLVPFHSTVRKETRILSHYEFIRDFFVFDKNYQIYNEYSSFIKDLTSYMRDGDNKHRIDAIDVLCSAANFIKLKYKNIIYQR